MQLLQSAGSERAVLEELHQRRPFLDRPFSERAPWSSAYEGDVPLILPSCHGQTGKLKLLTNTRAHKKSLHTTLFVVIRLLTYIRPASGMEYNMHTKYCPYCLYFLHKGFMHKPCLCVLFLLIAKNKSALSLFTTAIEEIIVFQVECML